MFPFANFISLSCIDNQNHKSGFIFSLCYQIIYCKSGTAYLACSAGTVLLKGGDCALIPPYLSYKIEYENFCADIVTFKSSYIKKSFSKNISSELLETGKNFIFKIRLDKKKNYIERIKSSEKQKNDFAFLDLARLLIYFRDISINEATVFPDNKSKSFFEITEYIKNNLSTPLYLSDIASHFATSTVNINRIFKKKFSITPAAYISGARFIQAIKMLSESEITINNICTACGYSSRTHFQNVFKKRTGMTPKTFRKMYSDNSNNDVCFKHYESYIPC